MRLSKGTEQASRYPGGPLCAQGVRPVLGLVIGQTPDGNLECAMSRSGKCKDTDFFGEVLKLFLLTAMIEVEVYWFRRTNVTG